MKKLLITLCLIMVAALSVCAVACTPDDGTRKGEPKATIQTDAITYTYVASSKGYSVKSTENAKTLTEIAIPDTIEGWPVTHIADYAFIRCDKLEKITIGANVVAIGSSAFASCSSLKSVSLPQSVRTVKDSAFKDCKALQSAVLPSEMKNLGRSVFQGCSRLSSVNIPGGITILQDSLFQNCNLTSITIPSNIITINSYAFGNNYSLTEVNLPVSLEKIGQYAFYSCTALEEILFPTGKALFLDDYAFAFSGLKKVYLPSDIQLGTYVFQKLRWSDELEKSSCEGIYYESEIGSRGINAFGYTWDNPEDGFRIYVPTGSMDYYKSENPGDESWGRCVVNVPAANPVLAEYDVATTFPDGFPCVKE